MKLSKLAVRRLTKLAKFMASLPKEADAHFNMRWWVLHNDSRHLQYNEHGLDEGPLTQKKLLSCGTAACAAGWAATVPSFRKAGFRMRMLNGALEPAITPAHFFDITMEQEHLLFGDSSKDQTPRQWAQRCMKFIKNSR